MMNEKIAVVKNLVANGYNLMGESVEDFAARFTLNDLQMFLNNFTNWKKNKEG